MKKAIIITVVVVVSAMLLVSPVQASTQDNYGGVSYAYKQKMINLIYANFGRGWKGQAMVRCAARESGFNPRAANWTDTRGGSFGLFQINGVHNPGIHYATKAWIAKMMNPYENIKVAKRLARNGLGPWGGGC